MKKLWGLVEYKLQWTLTLKGWLLVTLLAGTFLGIIITQIQPFLAMKAPIEANALLIEGWVIDSVIQGAVEEFKQRDYKVIITTGSPIYRGSFLSQYKTYAELSAATLIHLGINPEEIIILPTPETIKDRTAAAAAVVKKWLSQATLGIQAINIYSFDVHTRRSWFIYRQVLGNEIRIGAIAHPNKSYNAQYWWTASAGFRSVIEEAIAYLYARFIWRF